MQHRTDVRSGVTTHARVGERVRRGLVNAQHNSAAKARRRRRKQHPAAAAASVSHRTGGGVGASKWKRGSRRGPVEQPTNIDHQLVVGGKKE